uniref:Ribosomal protein S8 n=1 Tax=Acanthamoeba castellanii TaxID=5755 RepID=A0A0K1HQA1_ACACA|nr:ribosomal protein S8 [Acanthamoeba castellanii]
MSLLSNMLSIVKVGCNARHLQVTVQNSKLCINVLSVLYKLGYIRGFIVKDKKNVIILLKYINNKPVIRNIAVISTPGRRTYIKHKKLEKFLQKKDSGFLLLSTSKGILTDEESNMLKIGGEALLKIS